MRLCFIGDIAVNQITAKPKPNFDDCDSVIANLEGALLRSEDISIIEASRVALPVYNTQATLDVLHSYHVTGVSLANNHFYDLPLPAAYTQAQLDQHRIASFGAGRTKAEASKPLTLKSDDTVAHIFGFGWDIIGCKAATATAEGVNPLAPRTMLEHIRNLRATDKESCVIYFVHWNYEMEQYPQPAHRQLAHELIDAGVDAIVGLHPHVVQGAETVHGKPIVYSLGNWFFPPRKIGKFSLRFPKLASRQLAFQLEMTGRQVSGFAFHWYQFDENNHTLMLEASETKSTDPIIDTLTPFRGMTHQDYHAWFVKHRTRRRGLPVYADYHEARRNWLRDRYVFARQFVVSNLVRFNLKRGLSS